MPTQQAFSQERRYAEGVDLDRKAGVIRSKENAYSKDGGLAVLFGNLAEDGCVVKTAGVDESILTFSGPARIFESQDLAVSAILTNKISAILTNKIKEDVVVVIRYEGPRGGPACRRCSIRRAI